MTVEALAILPWYASLFDADVITRARGRLAEHHFDVDAFIANRTASPPAWWHDEG